MSCLVSSLQPPPTHHHTPHPVPFPVPSPDTPLNTDKTMLTPLHWFWNAPIALGWVVSSAIAFPVLRKLGWVAEPNELDYTNDMRDKTIIVTGTLLPPSFPSSLPPRECAMNMVG